ncbi:MAG: hypothetical protein HZB19_00500 [Chloroflexi bacterium]|nr:hypothetical protein [Chloroflexota bacterium]
MLHLNLNIQPKTAKRLKKILEFARDEETFAQNIITYQIVELKRGILNIKLDMKAYEEKYQMSSADFYEQYSQGKTDDREDYMIWAGLCEMLDKNEKQLQGLEG